MTSNSPPHRDRPSPAGRWTRVGLLARVQFDGFKLDPLGYLQAIAWRARGLRVRSRNRLAALTGRSASAYAFWIACREPKLRPKVDVGRSKELPDIVPVIDCRLGQQGIEDTLASVGNGAQPILLGTQRPGYASLTSIAELAGWCGAGEMWICPMRPGDRLSSDALAIYAGAVADSSDRSILYGDDDLADAQGVRTNPHFKPDWNPELFQCHDFLTGSSVVKVSAADVQALAGEEDWPAALIRRAIEGSPEPLHLPFVLHHRRERPEPIVPSRAPLPSAEALPRVSVIIPTRNGANLLSKCLEGVAAVDYPAVELIIVDNGSDDPQSLAYFSELRSSGATVIRIDGPFNYSALNNAGVRAATGEMLCFLNNDVEMIDGRWMKALVGHAMRPKIGAVGARLLYPDGSVQHAGVFTGIGGGAAHGHRYLREDEPGYFERARLPQRVSAVTGACLVVSREKFLAVGGFDETDFRVAFNDIDLCLKLNQRGWQSFYEPGATLIHHESKTRGSDRTEANRARFAGELAALKRKWGTDARRDPFHHPQLSPFCEQFVIAI